MASESIHKFWKLENASLMPNNLIKLTKKAQVNKFEDEV